MHQGGRRSIYSDHPLADCKNINILEEEHRKYNIYMRLLQWVLLTGFYGKLLKTDKSLAKFGVPTPAGVSGRSGNIVIGETYLSRDPIQPL